MSNKKIRQEGRRDFERGKDLDECPHEEDIEAMEIWIEGWIEASEAYESKRERASKIVKVSTKRDEI